MTDDSITLGEFCDQSRKITYGIVQPGKANKDGVPIVRVNNFNGHSLDLSEKLQVAPEVEASYQRSRPKPGDLLVSLVGSIGQVSVAPPEIEGWNLARAVGLVPFDDIKKAHWAAYAIQLKENQRFILQRANTTVQATFNLKDLAQIPIPKPGDDIEDAALRVLRMLDDKIELNRRMNETLEEMARALFRDWFVDFGPTRRQMEGATDPAAIMGHAFPSDKAATLAPLFPAKLGDDGLPEEWGPGIASEHIDFNPKEPLKKGTVAPYSDMASLPTNGSLIEPPVPRDFKSGMRFRNGDALIARITPCLENGKAGFVDYLTEEAPVGWGSTEFFVLRSKSHVAPQFAYCLVRDPDFRKRAEQSMTGTSGRQRAQIEVLMSYELAVPDDKVHAEFETITTPFFAKIKANGQENQTLAEMRDLLLPKLMSGEIRLKDAEGLIE